jgi:nucleoside-diphosphate kinase
MLCAPASGGGVVAKPAARVGGCLGQPAERNGMGNDTGIERTLVVLKPDAIARGLAGRIIARFEDALLKIVAAKMVWMGADQTRRHYFDLEERFGPTVYNLMADFMQSGPVLAMVLEGVDAVACTRKIVGSTYPDQAAPGTVRGDFAHMSRAYANAHGIAVANLVHASGAPDEAEHEIGVWFTKEEMFDYPTVAQYYLR